MRSISCILLIALLTLLSLVRGDMFSGYPYVTELTVTSYRDFIESSHKPVVILFFAPWCPHCQGFKDAYLKFAQQVNGVVRVGAINCDEQPRVGNWFNVTSYPTILMWKLGPKRYMDPPIEYHGARTTAALKNFVVTLAKDSNEFRVNSMEDIEKVVRTSKYQRAGIFFSTRTRPSFIQAVMSRSKALNGLPLIFVSKENVEELGKPFGVTEAPIVGVVVQNSTTGKLDFVSYGTPFSQNGYPPIAQFFADSIEAAKREMKNLSS